ncbi:MAG: glycosyltransferase [Armatimonadota bacterium]
MKIAFLLPHLRPAGRVGRSIHLGNELVGFGHRVSWLVPASESRGCEWLECRGKVDHIERSLQEPFDALVFTEEGQWPLVGLFRRVALTVYDIPGCGALYGKAGAKESYRFPVDLRLANSAWTAECIEREIGVRPTVLLGGVEVEQFRPVRVAKAYDVLTCAPGLPWKGTREVEEACRQAGVGLRKREAKTPQAEMARELCRARVFVVGSHFEGFGQSGLEALACAIPLVTTDNGGCREYAVHEQTALVVPPGDVDALASAIKRLLNDQALAGRLRDNGLRLVREKFAGWERSARRFEEIVSGQLEARQRLTLTVDRAYDEPRLETRRRYRAAQLASYTRPVPLDAAPKPPSGLASVITLSWDQLFLTQRLVESLKANTGRPYELVMVDNGSKEETRRYVSSAADTAILNEENVGFARGMNQGAKAAKGEFLVFINNDAEVPAGWLDRLLEATGLADRVGIVAPAVTAGGSFVTVRAEPHEIVREVLPFSLPPAAVCYLIPRAEFEAAGGWCEEYRLGGAEDVDLCFSMWARGRRVLVDERVLLTHHSKGTAAAKIADWEQLWRQNRQLLVDRWSEAEPVVGPVDGELASLFAELRGAPAEQVAALVDRIESLMKEREEAWAAERAAMAAGVAQSWREAMQQREVAAGLRRRLQGGLARRAWRRVVGRG